MEPVGWVSCGCGKGVTIYARKQQAKETISKVVKELAKAEPTISIDGMTLPVPEPSALNTHPERLCAWCGKTFSAKKYLKYCTWACYLASKHQAKLQQRQNELGSSAALPLTAEPDETEEEAKTQPDV